jgi:hypothetical protein
MVWCVLALNVSFLVTISAQAIGSCMVACLWHSFFLTPAALVSSLLKCSDSALNQIMPSWPAFDVWLLAQQSAISETSTRDSWEKQVDVASGKVDTHMKSFSVGSEISEYSLDIMLTCMAVTPCRKRTVEPVLIPFFLVNSRQDFILGWMWTTRYRLVSASQTEIYIQPVRPSWSDWLKVLLAGFLWEKNTAGWLTNLADNLKWKHTPLTSRHLHPCTWPTR